MTNQGRVLWGTMTHEVSSTAFAGFVPIDGAPFVQSQDAAEELALGRAVTPRNVNKTLDSGPACTE